MDLRTKISKGERKILKDLDSRWGTFYEGSYLERMMDEVLEDDDEDYADKQLILLLASSNDPLFLELFSSLSFQDQETLMTLRSSLPLKEEEILEKLFELGSRNSLNNRTFREKIGDFLWFHRPPAILSHIIHCLMRWEGGICYNNPFDIFLANTNLRLIHLITRHWYDELI